MESSPASQDILEPLKIFEAGNSERMADGVFVAYACHGRFSSALEKFVSGQENCACRMSQKIYTELFWFILNLERFDASMEKIG